ncbi:uncharacterized protein DSM5745_04983 [Aspergillus mulundensis]|uniref:Uncharacterized protein n=1 Tax=Aspergillus mulundensis TaxID=1810919 RepID=A0A3D8S598_9EURO|nr:hypothetical protein DSM5745_04983 [Aspergillus mulundensis]RDW81426.1 hypothetical protein DSM5745_04983 [Aspergillus mulundensis]
MTSTTPKTAAETFWGVDRPGSGQGPALNAPVGAYSARAPTKRHAKSTGGAREMRRGYLTDAMSLSSITSFYISDTVAASCLRYAKTSTATMIHNKITLAALLVGTLLTGTRARECLTNETVPLYGFSHSLTLTAPDQLTPLGDCETIVGDIRIHPDFAGSLVLNTVTNFTGRILGNLDADNHGLEAIEMRNLLSITDIRLYRIWGVRSIQMPRLESVAWQLDLIQGAENAVMDFGALKTVNMIDIAGTWTNVSFPALETVGSTLHIYTDPSREIVNDRLDAVDIDLPVLESVRDLRVIGHIQSLSTPKLEALGEPEEVAYPKEVNTGGLQVVANHTDMSGVLLPSLRELHGRFALDGHMSIIDLYGLEQTDATITVNAASPVEIYSALEEAGEIDIRGDLAVINFTNLTRASKLDIIPDSDSKLHCPASLIHAYRNINYPDEPLFCNAESLALAGKTSYTYNETSATSSTPTPSYTPTPTPYFSPTPTPSSGAGGGKLGAGGEAGIAVAAVAAGAVLIGSFAVRRYNKKRDTGDDATAEIGTGESGPRAAPKVHRGHAAHGPVSAAAPPVATGERAEVLPRHSADVAPPPYSR